MQEAFFIVADTFSEKKNGFVAFCHEPVSQSLML